MVFCGDLLLLVYLIMFLLQKQLLGRDSYIWKTNGGLNHTKVDDAIGFEIGRILHIREIGGYCYCFMAI